MQRWEKYLTREYSFLYLSYSSDCYPLMRDKVGTTINFDLAHGKGALVSLYGLDADFQNCYDEINEILSKDEKIVVKMMSDFEKFTSQYYSLVEQINRETSKTKLKQFLLKLDSVFVEILCRYLFFVYLGYGGDKPFIKKFLEKYAQQFEKVRNCGIDAHMDKQFPKLFGKYNKLFVSYLRLFSRGELLRMLNDESIDLKRIKQRATEYLLLTKHGETKEYYSNEIQVILDKELPKPENALVKSELHGRIANKGTAIGTAVVVLTEKDYSKILPGAILVTPMTKPSIVSFLSKVKAIVTDDGGALCHASIISRELNLPCIVGTKRATEIFKDGDLLEVDAVNGIVRKIS